MAIDINIPIEDSVTDGSLNPVTSNAVFDALADKANTADLATVATTGDYNDLDNKPTIPASQVNSDWNATSGVSEILNKPTIPSIAGLATVTYVDQQDALKVDKVAGKGLSTEDYTTAEKNKLEGIQAGAEVNVNADWNATSGDAQILNKPTIPSVTGFVPYTGATNDVDLGVHDLTATQGTFATSGNPDTLTVNHSSGSGNALTITKGGSGEGVYVNKTSGSGNAVTVVGDLEATNLKRTGGTSAQFLKANGSVDSTSYQPTLVSGTDIKTLEGQSLLGAGNIDLTKSDVGLSNVDNTSDLNKPISTATQTALNAKENTITAGTTSQYYRGDKTFQALDKTAVGLGNVDNTSDLNKPISTDTQAALNAKQDALTLTTTGTSGAATLTGATLNIPQYSGGGGGLVGLYNIFQGQSGSVINNRFINSSTSFNTYTNNIIKLHPYISNSTYTTSSIGIQVLTAQAGANIRILIYSNSATRPDTKLYESTNIDCSTTGLKTITTSFTFTAGVVYWIGFQNSFSSSSAMLASVTSLNLPAFLGHVASNSAYIGYQTSEFTFGSAPTTMGAVTADNTSYALLWLTIA